MSSTCKHDDAKLPDGWRKVRLDEIADVIGGSTPARDHDEFWGGSIPWVVPSEITSLSGRYLTASNETITAAGMAAAGLRMLPAGSVLLTSRATIGAAAINKKPVVTNQGFQNLVAKDGADSLWLYYCISSLRHEMLRRAAGSTFAEISRDSVRSLPIVLPPLPEQRVIANALDSIDEAIEGTETVIAATKTLRDSLLHELLTRGVPGWHTEWKDVPGIGTIPADWEVVRLGNVCERITKGTTPTTLGYSYTSNGVRFLRVENVNGGRVGGSQIKFISSDTHQLLARSVLQEGDVLMSIAGALGRSALVTGELLPANVNQALSVIRLDRSGRANPQFIALCLQGSGIQGQVEDMRAELAQANINLEQVGSLRVPLPPSTEQKTIVSLLSGVDTTIAEAERQQDGLRSLKESTAEALLTGEVRTNN